MMNTEYCKNMQGSVNDRVLILQNVNNKKWVSRIIVMTYPLSGRKDLNLRPRAPEADGATIHKNI